MARVIVSDNGAGGVGITVMSPKAKISIDDHMVELQSRGVICYAIIEDAALPDNAGAAMEYELDESTLTVTQKPYANQRRCFRNSWVWDGNNVVEASVLKDEMKKERARAVRNRMLELTDSEEFRLTGQELADIRAWRAALRNLGADIEADPDNVVFPPKP